MDDGQSRTLPLDDSPCIYGENTGPAGERVSWALIILSLVFLLLRLYCKWKKSNRFWWDDGLLIISFMFSLTAGTMFSVNVQLGFGLHKCELIQTRTPEQVGQITLISYVSGSMSVISAMLSKTSFAMTLLRITESRWLKVTIWVLVSVLDVTMVSTAIMAVVQCEPVEKAWNPSLPGHCWPEVFLPFGISITAYSGIVDIALAMLPWKIIYKLQIRTPEKIGIAVAMSAGVIAGAAAFIKSTHVAALQFADFSHDGYDLVVWSAAELSLTIIAACIPFLRVLIQDVKKRSTRYYQYGLSAVSGTGGAGGGGTSSQKKRHRSTVGKPGTGFGEEDLVPGEDAHGKSVAIAATANANATTMGDDWSQRSILNHGSDDDENCRKGYGGIRTTHEVRIEYHTRLPHGDLESNSIPMKTVIQSQSQSSSTSTVQAGARS